MEFALIIPAFIAGLLTFLAPCTLPLVPGYIGFISGISMEDLHDPAKARRFRKQIFLNGVLFVLGFSAVFIIFGTLAGLLGQSIAEYRIWFSRIGGIMVILFGLFMLDIIKIGALMTTNRFKPPKWLVLGRPVSSFIIGATFGFGWTPCVGPILGSILFLAANTSTALQGAFLLAVFSAGLAVPFLLVAAGLGSASKYIHKLSKYLKIVSYIGGVFLIFLGILLITNNFSILIQWGYSIFSFIEYDRLLQFL